MRVLSYADAFLTVPCVLNSGPFCVDLSWIGCYQAVGTALGAAVPGLGHSRICRLPLQSAFTDRKRNRGPRQCPGSGDSSCPSGTSSVMLYVQLNSCLMIRAELLGILKIRGQPLILY